jgi:hypothetical protein
MHRVRGRRARPAGQRRARRWSLLVPLALALALTTSAGCGGDERRCGGGSWQPGALEIHHFAIGQADATLLVGPGGETLLVDLGETAPERSAGAERVGAAIERVLGCRRLDQALITHFHLDHAGAVGQGGLWHLVERQGFHVGRLLHRDAAGFRGEAGDTLAGWRGYLAQLAGAPGRRPRPVLVAEGVPLSLGPAVAARVVAVDGAGVLHPGDFSGAPAPPSENDYSVALALRFGRLDYFVGGDLSGEHLALRGGPSYHDVETAVAARVGDVDVYRVDHHGSAHASNPTLLGQLDPRVAIVSAGRGNPHGHPHAETMDRLLQRSAVYVTEAAGSAAAGGRAARVAGDVVVRTRDGLAYTVAGDAFLAEDPPRADGDGDGYFREVDPDDRDPAARPRPFGGCDPAFQRCPPAPGAGAPPAFP